ncbi:MAG TPA: DUF5677 domain-containing protein [Acidimicrobiales bacterium]
MSKEECLAASKELNRYITTKFIRHLTSRNNLAPRIYAFAAFARCNRLLTGMIAMHEAGYDDLAGINLRPVVECWFIGTYLLLAPDEANGLLLLLHKEQLERMAKGGWENFEWAIEEIEKFEIDGKVHDWKWIAQRVDELLKESGEDQYVTSELVYNTLYRGGSHSELHAGLGTLQGHVEVQGETTFTVEIRRGEAYEMDRTKPAASLVGLFALMIAERIAFSDPELLRLHQQVLNCGDPRA